MGEISRRPVAAAGLAAAVLAISIVGCTGPAPSSPPGLPTPTPTGTVASASATPIPSTASPSIAPSAGWIAIPDQPSLSGARFEEVAAVPGGFVAVGCLLGAPPSLDCEAPAAWSSADGIEWSPGVRLPTHAGESQPTATAMGTAGGRLVIGGHVMRGEEVLAALWLYDGSTWSRVADDAALSSSIVTVVTSHGDRHVVLGAGAFAEAAGFKAWWSDDGRVWQPAPEVQAVGFPQAAIEVDGALLAWGSANTAGVGSDWWQSTDGRRWDNASQPAGLEGAWLDDLAPSATGFVAHGSVDENDQVIVRSWTSDGGPWQAAEPPPGPVDRHVTDQVAIGRGAAAAGIGPSDEGLVALLWLRGPGEDAWRPPAQLPGTEIVGLVRHPADPTLVIAIGRTAVPPDEHVVIRIARVDWPP